MAKGGSKIGKSGGNKSAQDNQEKFIDDLANDLVKNISQEDLVNGEIPLSNSDLQAAVEAYAMTHKGVNEDALLEEIENRAIDKKYGNTTQTAIKATNIKVGDEIDADIRINGTMKRVQWTFHPEGYDTFKAEPYSNIKITDVKVTGKTVKVTGLFDNAVTKRNPQKSDYGKDFTKVTKTFKKSDIVKRKKK